MMDAFRGFCALEGDKEGGMAGEPGVYRKRDVTEWAVSQAPRPMIKELSQAPFLLHCNAGPPQCPEASFCDPTLRSTGIPAS